MRIRMGLLGIAMLVALSASATPTVIRDWVLHRQWRVECDRVHPERPARLVEVPWSIDDAARRSSQAPAGPTLPQPPAVRTGMRVTVIRRGAMADIRLRGMALGSARIGEQVGVRAGLGNSVVRGVVRGPGVVELVPEKAR